MLRGDPAIRGPQPAKESRIVRPSTSRLVRRSAPSSTGLTAMFISFSTGTSLFCNQLPAQNKRRINYHIVKKTVYLRLYRKVY